MRQVPWTCVDASPVQQTCVAPAASSTLAAEPERVVDPLVLGRLEVDVEALAAVLVDGDGRVVVVVRHARAARPSGGSLRTASTSRGPQSGPCSSLSVVANEIGSWIVVASITKPPSSSCWKSIAVGA